MGTDFQDIIGGWRSTLAFKAPCRCGSTSNITLSGFQTIDGVTPVATDTNLRILVMGQTDATTNGIYVMQASLWLRWMGFRRACSRRMTPGTLTHTQARRRPNRRSAGV